jgi:ubiquinone/menaquinone biosynthesis C-methylase UbiE
MPTQEIQDFYDRGKEIMRLGAEVGELEFVRTLEILARYLPAKSAILDVGGGPGTYMKSLCAQGHRVDLIDIVPLHVQQARKLIETERLNASANTGDARKLSAPDSSADAVLLLGPLYHLTDRNDRMQTLREAFRVVKPDGIVAAAGISRFASALDGYASGFMSDPVFQQIVRDDLSSGQHRNPNDTRGYFTTAFLHHPDELEAEVGEACFAVEGVFALEGPLWMLPAAVTKFMSSPESREMLLAILRTIERERTLLGACAHMLAVGRKP